MKALSSKLISVHSEPVPLRFFVPNVHPGEYHLPGVNCPADEIERVCKTVARAYGEPPENGELVCYAKVKENGFKYVELTVFEAVSFSQSPAQQTHDERGNRMQPDVQRMATFIRPEQMAQEVMRSFGKMGILAISGQEATPEELKKVRAMHLAWMQSVVQETNKWFGLLGSRQVTEQARRVAWELHKMGKLNPLPEWATVNPELSVEDVMNCIGCGTTLPKNAPWCSNPACGVIFNWKMAVDYGKVAPRDVPPSRRAEAGLAEPSTPPAPPAAPAAA